MTIDVETIRKTVSLRALAEAAGAKFGENNSSACPLHQGKNPRSFHVYRGTEGIERWHCFTGCQTGGDVIAFYMRWKQVDFRTAVEELAAGTIVATPAPAAVEETSRVVPPPSAWQDTAMRTVIRAQDSLWKSGSMLSALFQDRGLVERTVGLWMLGWNPQPTESLPAGIVIPCWRDGFLWYVKVRRKENRGAKYLSLAGGVNTLFGTDHWQGHRTLIVTEGEFDCMLTWQVIGHIADVVAVPGASTHLTVEDLAALARYERIIALYDNDKAGQAGAAYLQQAVGARVEVATVPPSAKDICEYYLDQEYALDAFLLGLVAGRRESAPEPAGMYMERYMLNEPELGWRKVT